MLAVDPVKIDYPDQCLLLAQSGHCHRAERCLLSEVKRTLAGQQVSGTELASSFGHCHSSFRDFGAFAQAKVISDDQKAPDTEIGRPNDVDEAATDRHISTATNFDRDQSRNALHFGAIHLLYKVGTAS